MKHINDSPPKLMIEIKHETSSTVFNYSISNLFEKKLMLKWFIEKVKMNLKGNY